MRRNIITALPMLFLALVFLTAANGSQITIIPDPLYANLGDFALWSNTLYPELAKIANLPTVSTIYIQQNPAPSPGLDVAVCPSTTLYQPTPYHNDGLLIGPNAFGFFHESNHIRTCGWLSGGYFGEAYTQAVDHSTFFLSAQDNPGLMIGWTAVEMADLRLNYDPNARGGEANFGLQRFYDDPAGILEGLIGGSYFATDNSLRTTDWLTALKQLPDFDGMPAADRFVSSPINHYNGPDGQYLYIDAVQWPYDSNGKQVLYADTPVFNDRGTFSWELRDRKNGVGKLINTGHVNFAVIDFFGKIMTSGLSDYNVPGSGLIDPTGWPDAKYTLVGCWVAPGTGECDPQNPGQAPSTTTIISVLRSIPNWWLDHIFVFNNGLASYGASNTRQLVQTSGNIAKSISLPGLLVIDTSDSRDNVVVSDGIRSKTYSVAYRDPLYAHSPSRFIPWTSYNETLWAVTSASDYAPGILAPGQITVAWGQNFTPNAPTKFVNAPLPTTMDNLQVVARSGGVDYICPLFFTSTGQINFQTPTNLPVGPAEVRILIAGQATNNIHVDVVASRPSVFQMADGSPAVIFAYTGQLVTPSNPAKPGDILSIYGTGLGQTNPPIESGAAYADVSWANIPAVVSLSGKIAQVYYSGGAVGFVGLDQINISVPEGISGLTPLMLGSASAATAQGKIAIAH